MKIFEKLIFREIGNWFYSIWDWDKKEHWNSWEYMELLD